MFTLPSQGLNTLKLISANRVLVASCFLKSPRPCCAGKYPRGKPFLVPWIGLFVPALGGQRLPCDAMQPGTQWGRGGTGLPWGPARRRGPGLAPSRPGPAAAAGEGAAPGPARERPQQEVGARRRRRRFPAGAGLSWERRCPTGRARWVVERDGARGATAALGRLWARIYILRCGSAPSCLSKIAGTVTNTLQVKQAGGGDNLKAL